MFALQLPDVETNYFKVRITAKATETLNRGIGYVCTAWLRRTTVRAGNCSKC